MNYLYERAPVILSYDVVVTFSVRNGIPSGKGGGKNGSEGGDIFMSKSTVEKRGGHR